MTTAEGEAVLRAMQPIYEGGPHVIVDGARWYKFFATYRHAGHEYSFEFYAPDYAEAQERLRSIRTTAVEFHQVCGEITASVPGAGLWARLICWWRNLFT